MISEYSAVAQGVVYAHLPSSVCLCSVLRRCIQFCSAYKSFLSILGRNAVSISSLCAIHLSCRLRCARGRQINLAYYNPTILHNT